MNLPSGDQLLGTAKLLDATSNSSCPAPLAGLRYIPTPILSYATYLPSGDQIGLKFPVGPNVSWVATPVANSSTQVCPPRSPTSRFPSGAIIATEPAPGISPSF